MLFNSALSISAKGSVAVRISAASRDGTKYTVNVSFVGTAGGVGVVGVGVLGSGVVGV